MKKKSLIPPDKAFFVSLAPRATHYNKGLRSRMRAMGSSAVAKNITRRVTNRAPLRLLYKSHLLNLFSERVTAPAGEAATRKVYLMTDKPTHSTPVLLTAFQHVHVRLQRIAGQLLGNTEDAEDALQDAFVRLWPRRERIDKASEAEALLTTTVRHLSIDRLRQRAAHPEDDPADERTTQSLAADDSAAGREQLFRDVESIIERELPHQARDILRRREYEGESFESIAADMGMTPEAVRMQLSRIRKRVRQLYQNQHHHEI